jgi:chromosome partitioning protein
MLGWLRRKTAPIPGEPSRESEDGDHSGEERLGRLLDRLGSEPGATGQQADAATAPRAEPPAGESSVEPETAASVPAASRERSAEPPEAAVPQETYPPASAPAAAEPIAAAEPKLEAEPGAAERPPEETAAAGEMEPAESKPAQRRGATLHAAERPARSDGNPPVEAAAGGLSPMFIIAVASQKGGAGKTTIAAHLAVRAGLAGHGPVVLIDTDPQGSLAEWWHARHDDTPALAVAKPEQLGASLAELRSYGTAVAVIDTPPALTGAIEQVIAMADLIIVPVRPSPHDLRAAAGTVEMARRAGKPFMFVVNGAAPRAGITAQAIAALSEHGRVAPVVLYQRTEYAASMIDGRTVTEAAAAGRSAQEIAELWQCVWAQVGMRVAA